MRDIASPRAGERLTSLERQHHAHAAVRGTDREVAGGHALFPQREAGADPGFAFERAPDTFDVDAQQICPPAGGPGGIGEDRQIAIEEEGALELVRLHEPLELCRGRRRVLQEACRRFARAPQPLVEDLIESADRPGMEEGRRG